MKYVKGDLIKLAKDGEFDAICHGCNCYNTFGAGIARLIKSEFHKAYLADCKTHKGDKKKLGTYSKADFILQIHDGSGYVVRDFTVINAYTQYYWGRKNGVAPISYKAVEQAFTKINKDFKGKTIGIPKIGAGLAGGDWDKIETIIKQVTPNVKIIVVEYVV